MIILEAKNDITKPKIAVVGCLHGNELLGLDVFRAVQARITEFDNLLFIIANVDAYRANKRSLDQDLNRSFPGDAKGNREQRIAAEIYRLVHDADMLIDIHTTTSPGFGLAAISGQLSAIKKRVISAFGAEEVVIMQPDLLSASLIGNTKEGVSLEYGVTLAEHEDLAASMVDALFELQKDTGIQKASPFSANIYDVVGVIPRKGHAHLALENFKFSEELGGYPFILDEKSYTDTRGFLVTDHS